MLLTCAANALCGMKNSPLNNPADHHCMLCEGPIHGALCSKLYCEDIVGNPSYKNPAADLNDHANALANSHTALMCLHCVQHKLTAAAPTADAAVDPPAVAAIDLTAAAPTADAAVAAVDPPAVAAVDPVAAPPAAPPAVPFAAAQDSKKKRDATLYAQYEITPLPSGKFRIACKHCPEYNKVLKTFNATRARKHSLQECEGLMCPITKRRIEGGAQANKKQATLFALQSDPSETVAAMRSNHGPAMVIDLLSDSGDVSDVTKSTSTPVPPRKKTKRVPSAQTTMENMYGKTMNQASADIVLMNEVRAIVARGEPLRRLLDPWVQASLHQRYPAILKFIPSNVETIYDRYVIKIDKDTTSELKSFMAKIPGHVNVAMDGVTVLGKQKVRDLSSIQYFIAFNCLTTISVALPPLLLRLYTPSQRVTSHSSSSGKILEAISMLPKPK